MNIVGEHKTNSDDYMVKGDEIGKGGFGSVYKGVYKPTGQVVAIKEIDVSHRILETEKNRLKRLNDTLKEVNILKLLGNDCKKYFLCYVDYFVDDITLVIVTEYLEGYTTLTSMFNLLEGLFFSGKNRNVLTMFFHIRDAILRFHF